MISGLYSKFSDYCYEQIYGYELSPTESNLRWALQQNDEKILNYFFKKDELEYSILGFSVLLNDRPAVSRLIDLKADLTQTGSNLMMGNILHFYMDCLKESLPPNLEILQLLLNNIDTDQINACDVGYDETPLQYALMTMVRFKSIHWNVIELLLERGAKITQEHDPFSIFEKTSGTAYPERSFEKEEEHLDHLVQYLDLEKKYPQALEANMKRLLKGPFTLEEFLGYTANFRRFFQEMATFLNDDPTWVMEALLNSEFVEDKAAGLTDINQNKSLKAHEESNSDHKQQSEALNLLCEMLTYYHHYFSKLVCNTSFKECFRPWQLNVFLRAIDEDPSLRSKIFPLLD